MKLFASKKRSSIVPGLQNTNLILMLMFLTSKKSHMLSYVKNELVKAILSVFRQTSQNDMFLKASVLSFFMFFTFRVCSQCSGSVAEAVAFQ